MARYALTNIWSYNGDIGGRCIGVYSTKKEAQEAMKKAVEDTKLTWVISHDLIPEREFKVIERIRKSSIINLANTDWEKFAINDIEIND